MLIKRSKNITNFTLPVIINGYRSIWYYDCESILFKAYRQLKQINGKVKPLYPVIY